MPVSKATTKARAGWSPKTSGSCCGGCCGSGPFSKSTMIEKLIAAAWNRLAAPNKSTAEQGSGLDLGFQVIDGEVLRRRAHLPQSKRAEHVAILGKTGQGKSFFLRHLASQDIHRGQGFVFFDLHGDTMPFLLRLIVAEERKRGADLSEKLIVIEPGDRSEERRVGEEGRSRRSP